tara:strand:+ start:693 stop:941 length:249 start_codon:yes stop_codon:yes gene_type:complete
MASITNLIPIIGASISIGGIIFQIGKQAEKLHNISFQIDALENNEKEYNNFMNNINSKLLLADEKLKNIENDVKYIKSKIIK